MTQTKIVDRYISLEDKICDQPLASKHPSLDDYELVNIDAWENSIYTTPLFKRRLSDRYSRWLSPDSFRYKAYACYLLSQTLDRQRQGDASSYIRAVAALLEDFLGRLIDPLTRKFGKFGTFYSATSMTIRQVTLLIRINSLTNFKVQYMSYLAAIIPLKIFSVYG